MDYKLSAKETVGVLAVGLAASEVARRVANAQKSQKSHQIAMVVGGTALYFAGVYIGTNRPAAGWISAGSYNQGSCSSCGSHNIHHKTCLNCGCKN
jgi:tRNA A37 N6-isopentenylltransferase MiaA